MRKTLTALAIISCGFTLMAADPIVGTWKVNVEKSKMRNPVQSEIMKIEETAPNTYRCVFDIVTPTGEKVHREIIRIADGKEHPVEGVNTNAAGASEITSPGLRRVVRNRDGKYFGELQVQFSSDNKVHTVTGTGTDASGKPYKNLVVYERQ